MSDKIRRQLNRLDGLKETLERVEKLIRVEKILSDAGISTWGNYEEELSEALKGKPNQKVKYILDNIEKQFERLNKIVN